METLDYRTTMQAAALAYLRRHKDQHLGDADLLFDNCVRHLCVGLEVPLFLAQKVSQLAWDELHGRHEALWLGIDWAADPAATVAYLVDTTRRPSRPGWKASHEGQDQPAGPDQEHRA
jgi:hypothetical protein